MGRKKSESKEEIKETIEEPIDLLKMNILSRNGYQIYFMNPNDEKGLNDLRNTGKVFGEVAVVSITNNDKIDELAIFIRR